ncbi:MAG: hypothetical protein CMB80_00945 [Flammeovirgaceae bacterium]|nr:hypothetical protein [Flammeovirgaceae bacterium]|tara:strand:- start:1162 stop:1560 length:399 start_codon:yes stop_codon:yes gene_type:complete
MTINTLKLIVDLMIKLAQEQQWDILHRLCASLVPPDVVKVDEFKKEIAKLTHSTAPQICFFPDVVKRNDVWLDCEGKTFNSVNLVVDSITNAWNSTPSIDNIVCPLMAASDLLAMLGLSVICPVDVQVFEKD